MNIRNIAVAGGFAVGAALAFAPLASADDLTPVVDSEISMLNSLFDSEAAIAGDSADIISASPATGAFDTIPLTDAPDTAPFTTLDYELWGISPAVAGPTSDPGSYDLFNGALGKFDDAVNVLLYAGENNGALIPADDLFGSHVSTALSGGTDASAFEYLYNFAIGDLSGYLDGANLSALDISATTATELFSLF
jgi:hypothetical protein